MKNKKQDDFYECSYCKQILPDRLFYRDKQGCRDPYCKCCRTEGCEDSKPWTFFYNMKCFDIPFIENKWLETMGREIKRSIKTKTKYGGEPGTIFGQYLSSMKLKAYKELTWEDSKKYNNRELSDFAKKIQDLTYDYNSYYFKEYLELTK